MIVDVEPRTDHNVVLADERLVLRAFGLDDAEAIFQAVRASLPELNRWLSWCTPEYSLNDTRQFLEGRAEAFRKDGEYSFAMWEKGTGAFVGAIGLNQLDRATMRANLGYWLRTAATGQGYATVGTRMLARWGVENLGLQRIEIVAAVGNFASQRVAERVGATREGIARNRLRVHGVPTDAVLYSLIPSDLLGGE